jgi:hypothetical protein
MTAVSSNLFERLDKGRPQPTAIRHEKAQSTDVTPSAEEAPPAVGLLERLEKERSLLPIEEALRLLGHKDDSPLGKLQDWLDRKWRRSSICLREICVYGPHADRNRQTVLNLALELVRQGVLVPIEARQRNTLKWRIVRKSQRPAASAADSQPQATAAT